MRAGNGRQELTSPPDASLAGCALRSPAGIDAATDRSHLEYETSAGNIGRLNAHSSSLSDFGRATFL
jgi:hypothetical protein